MGFEGVEVIGIIEVVECRSQWWSGIVSVVLLDGGVSGGVVRWMIWEVWEVEQLVSRHVRWGSKACDFLGI